MDETTRCIQQAGAASRVDIKALGDAFGNVADGEDSDRIIRRTNIRESDQRADTQFGSCAAAYAAGDMLDDVVEAAIMVNDREDAAGKHGDEDQFAHAHHALQRAVYPCHEIKTAVEDAGEAGE